MLSERIGPRRLPLPEEISLPLDEAEEALVPTLAREYRALPDGGHAGTDKEPR
jgi:hypothetical protein